MAIRLVEIVNLKTGDGGHAVLGLCGRQIFYKILNILRTVWVRISLYIIEGGKHMELEELYDRIYRYCYFHTGRILSGLKTGHSSDRQAEAGKVLQFSAL